MKGVDEKRRTDIMRAVELLRAGNIVAFPTETVYGLGADALNEQAIRAVYRVKGRPRSHPVIVHLAQADDIRAWARTIPDSFWLLAEAFLPGPLTVVLPKANHVPNSITGGQDTVALRVPAHPIAQSILREFGGGVIAPSANRYGSISPTTAEAVQKEFGDEVFVVDGGQSHVGLESTIIDLTGEVPRVLRPGMISEQAIQAVLRTATLAQNHESTAPAVPGDKRSHYAPGKPVSIVADAAGTRESAVLALRTQPAEFQGVHWDVLPIDAAGYAQALYAALRRADETGADAIYIEQPPIGPDWTAIHDRITRAAAPREEDI